MGKGRRRREVSGAALPLHPSSVRGLKIQPTDCNHMLAFNQLEVIPSSPSQQLFGSVFSVGTPTSGARRI